MKRFLTVAVMTLALAATATKVQSPVAIHQAPVVAAAQATQTHIATAPAIVVTLQSPVGMSDAGAWVINGQYQDNIPFWFTLKEAIEAYYGLQ